MKVYGTNHPGAYALGTIPGKSGYKLLRVFGNVTAESEGYSYEEYMLELPDVPGLETDIAGNVGGYLAAARAEEKSRLARTCPKGEADAEAERRETEQSLTDLYLDGVQAQQDITDLQIQILEG